MKQNKRSALKKLKEKGLRERFLSLKQMFEDESKEQAEIELQFNKEIEREQNKLKVIDREQKVLNTRIQCYEDENLEIERELEKTQKMLDDICSELQNDGTAWRNELQELKFKVVNMEHENKTRENNAEDQENSLFNDIERSLKQQQKTNHMQVMEKFKLLNKKKREKNDGLIGQIRRESKALLRELELEREADSRMKVGLAKKMDQHGEVMLKANHEIGLAKENIRKMINGRKERALTK